MKAADRFAACKAIVAGLYAQMEADSDELLEFTAEHGVKSFTTPFGPVTVAEKGGGVAVRFNDSRLVEWLREHAPEHVETVTRVRASSSATVENMITAVGGVVVHVGTGEVVDVGTVVDVPTSTVVTYPSSNGSRAAKEQARLFVAERAAELTESLSRKAVES